MADRLKNRRAESGLGTVNTDLTRTTPRSDPRFYDEPEEGTEKPATGGVRVAGGKISASAQVLPGQPAGWPRNDSPITVRGK